MLNSQQLLPLLLFLFLFLLLLLLRTSCVLLRLLLATPWMRLSQGRSALLLRRSCCLRASPAAESAVGDAEGKQSPQSAPAEPLYVCPVAHVTCARLLSKKPMYSGRSYVPLLFAHKGPIRSGQTLIILPLNVCLPSKEPLSVVAPNRFDRLPFKQTTNTQ